MEKYSKLLFILMISLVIFVTAFIFREHSSPPLPDEPAPDISASEVKNLRRPSTEPDKKYLLKLEGNTLTAYHVENGVRKQIEKTEIEISSITPADIKLLQEGVYADSAEELFLYFESYTS